MPCSLHTVGLKKSDIEHVHLQHPEGRVALERHQVDAWAGLGPHMEQANWTLVLVCCTGMLPSTRMAF
jgi:hypothetical protein